MSEPFTPKAVDQPAPSSGQDPPLYRLLVGGLIAAVLLVISFVFVLALYERAAPEGLIAIGAAAVGGLVGLLVPSPVSKAA